MLELDYDLGNTQKVKEILVDCDSDAIIYLVEPSGPAYVILVKKFAFIINQDRKFRNYYNSRLDSFQYTAVQRGNIVHNDYIQTL